MNKNDDINKLVLEAYSLKQQVGKLLLCIDEIEGKIQKYFDESGEKEINIQQNESSNVVNCKKIERVTMNYNVDLLKKRLDDEMFIEVTKRSYEISDINAMISLMKDAGVKAKDFKALIIPKISVDNQAVKRLYDAGEITMKQLKGTFTAKISKSIKYTEKVGD